MRPVGVWVRAGEAKAGGHILEVNRVLEGFVRVSCCLCTGKPIIKARCQGTQ